MGFPTPTPATPPVQPIGVVTEQPPHDALRRLQIGAAGVVSVLLLVGLAGLATDRARENIGYSSDARPDAQSMSGNNNAPLEELGVQAVSKDGSAAGAADSAPASQEVIIPIVRPTVPDLEPDPALQRARQNQP